MKRETYVLVPAVDSAGRVLNGSIQWDALLTELERSLAHAHGYSGNACLGCGIGSHDKRLSDRALVALALIQYLSCAMFGARCPIPSCLMSSRWNHDDEQQCGSIGFQLDPCVAAKMLMDTRIPFLP